MTLQAADADVLTGLLAEARAGNDAARERLFSLVYGELRSLAGRLMHRERPDHTLQPTALVHEAYARLGGLSALRGPADRSDFFRAATRVMVEVLVDHARHRATQKRGGGRRRVPLLDHWLDQFERRNLDVLAVREALERLATIHERQSRVVAMRFLLGMTAAEVAEQLGVSLGTVEGDWRIARAWLRRELGEAEAS